jgi:hypothetical protein
MKHLTRTTNFFSRTNRLLLRPPITIRSSSACQYYDGFCFRRRRQQQQQSISPRFLQRHFSHNDESKRDDDLKKAIGPTIGGGAAPGPATGGGGGGATAATPSADEKSVESILRAPYQKISQPGLFPWRHAPEPLPRLIPGTSDHEEKGCLVGGNVVSSNPNLDALATAYFFLKVPWYNLLFFRKAWEQDLGESMSWAFHQSIPAMLSNTFQRTFYTRIVVCDLCFVFCSMHNIYV